jgi:DNA polymerase (family 10)
VAVRNADIAAAFEEIADLLELGDENPFFSILAHPTGRLIERRAPYDVDMLAVIRKAKKVGVALELNAHPDRLDLTDAHCRMAKEEGAPVAVSSDALDVHGLEVLRYGVGQARRGWLERTDALNVRPIAEPRRWLTDC